MSKTFTPERLKMARCLRGWSSSGLAREVGVSAAWYSKIERGKIDPTDETVSEIASALNYPLSFFYRASPVMPETDDLFFRASSKLARRDEDAAGFLASLASEISEWMDSTYDLPSPGIPEVQELSGAEIGQEDIELSAQILRSEWGLGNSPVSNMLGLLEFKGARVFSVSGEYIAIDAYSFRHLGKSIAFLNPTKSAERLRFDLAHELGHLLLHSGSLRNSDTREREREANQFASAFLMPRSGLLGSVQREARLEDIYRLRDEWRVSAMAVAHRLHQVGVTSDWVYRMHCQELAKRGFRRAEPGSTLVPEQSTLWPQVLSDLRSQGAGLQRIADQISVRVADVKALLTGLVPFAVGGEYDELTQPSGRLRVIEGALRS